VVQTAEPNAAEISRPSGNRPNELTTAETHSARKRPLATSPLAAADRP
jgi:hypothetical protein